jgi:hypothetical protein
MNPMNRRTFLKTTALTAGAIAIPNFVPSTVFGQNAPSEKIVMASIGTGGQGRGNLNNFLQHPDVKVVAVCDVDKKRQPPEHGQRCLQEPTAASTATSMLAKEKMSMPSASHPRPWHGLTSIAPPRPARTSTENR